MRQFRSKEDENPKERRLKELKKELDLALQKGDMQSFSHAQFKLREMEAQIEEDEHKIAMTANIIGGDFDYRKNDEINRRMLQAIDAKL